VTYGDERQAFKGSYLLCDEADGRERQYSKVMLAREAGQEWAEQAGLNWEGWRQERPNVWFLLPDKRFSIMVKP